jgi:hypothetical protein
VIYLGVQRIRGIEYQVQLNDRCRLVRPRSLNVFTGERHSAIVHDRQEGRRDL